jgi:hypothetical protein
MDDAIVKARTISLVTYRKNGTAVPTPVWGVLLDGKLYVNTDTHSWKVRRLRRDPRIRVAPSSMRGAPKGDYRDGTGRVVEDPAVSQRVSAALRTKYGWQTALTPLLGMIWKRFRERTTLELAL